MENKLKLAERKSKPKHVDNVSLDLEDDRGEGQKWTYVTELHHPDLSQFTDTTVGSFGLEKELSERHLFTSEEFPHFGGRV